MQDSELQRNIDERIKKLVPEILKGSAFTAKKITDMPNDALSVVSRRYVTLNGTSANRPVSSVIGQSYYDTTLQKPVWWNGTGFKDSQGNYV